MLHLFPGIKPMLFYIVCHSKANYLNHHLPPESMRYQDAYRNIFSTGLEWNLRTISVFLLLVFLPNLLGMINISAAGFKIHFFQLAVILAAAVYGPVGGLAAGLVGSINSAMIMHNPYLIVGNMILGLFAGLFIRKGFNAVQAVLLAFAIQLPWLIVTDLYLVHLPISIITSIIIALLISNTIWSVVVHYSAKQVKKALC
jgi:hypothetical protein